jgi:hypothetical protein
MIASRRWHGEDKMPLFALIVLIPLGGVSNIFVGQTVEVFDTKIDCLLALQTIMELSAVCLEIK